MVTRRGFLKAAMIAPPLAWVAYKSSSLFASDGAAPAAAKAATIKVYSVEKKGYIMVDKINKTAEEWKKILTPEQFHVLREKGTEYAFSGKYWNNHEKGIYQCAACKTDLFSSDTKFESGTGWPSFWQPLRRENVQVATDSSFGMERDEVQCARCGGHLGHVFDDGPKPTGLRYCMNSVSLFFVKA